MLGRARLGDGPELGVRVNVESFDQSAKILYVSPKTRGFLGGISYAPDADDAGYADLLQVGLTHERYWAQNVLRLGGSYTFVRGDQTDAGRFEDLQSLNLGVTATLEDSLMLGISGTYNGEAPGTKPPRDKAKTAEELTERELAVLERERAALREDMRRVREEREA